MTPAQVIKSGQVVRYFFDEECFFIDSPLDIDRHFKETLNSMEQIKQTSREYNQITEIHSADLYTDDNLKDRILIKTENLKDYYPMILMKSNFELYSEREAFQIKEKFKDLLSKDVSFLEDYYNQIVSAYQQFIDNTGFYFFDMSSNNIMIQKSSFDFKIIDILSIKKVDFKEIEVDPLSVLFYHNVVKHKVFDAESLKIKCKRFFNFIDGSLDVREVINKISKIKKKKLIYKEER